MSKASSHELCEYVQQFKTFYLFIPGLFNDNLSSSDYNSIKLWD